MMPWPPKTDMAMRMMSVLSQLAAIFWSMMSSRTAKRLFLIMLQKIAASWDSTDIIRMAMSVFGGHGIMEDFSSLLRLFRDSAINELWEGPRNVLLTQIHRDFQRAGNWYGAEEFVEDVLAGADEKLVSDLGAEMRELVAWPSLFTMDEATMKVCGRWDAFCHRLFHAYQDCALHEVSSKSRA